MMHGASLVVRLLFIGNSLTAANNLPATIEAMGRASGVDVECAAIAKPNFSLEDHWANGEARRAIARGGWSYVVLQQGPSALPESRALLNDYVRRFDGEIRRAGARTAIFMAWPATSRRADFDAVSASYAGAANLVGGVLLPVGDAWRAAWARDPALALYGADGFHPSRSGSYLAALVIFRTLIGRLPADRPSEGVAAADSTLLRSVAAQGSRDRLFVEDVRVIREWDGDAAGDQFGWIARNAGDVDGDGIPDVVTSAPTARSKSGLEKAGRVYVFSTKTGKLLWTAEGGAAGDQLGSGVEAAGDTNKDGIPDVIASAPGGGYANVYSGRDGRLLLTLRGEKAGDNFGMHAAGAGDVNHDGYADLIVGAPTNGAAGAAAGRAYVFSGKDGSVLLTLSGEREGDRFGNAVAGFADRTRTLLIVGAPRGGSKHTGRAYIYDALATHPKFVIDADETGAALGGMFLSVPGDMDGDGVPDVYVSDWRNNAKGPSTGRVYVHSGADGRRIFTLTGETAGEGFGTSPSVAGDVDGDGRPDLIVGAWQYSGGAKGAGRAYLYSGKSGRLLKTYTSRIAGDAFGFDAVSLGDLDGDGTIDLLITAAWSGVHGEHSGRIFIISSGIDRHAAPPR
jgi:hypothetical protein